MSYILLGEDSRFAAEVWVLDYTGDFLFCVAKCCKYGRERKELNKIAGNTSISDIHSKEKERGSIRNCIRVTSCSRPVLK